MAQSTALSTAHGNSFRPDQPQAAAAAAAAAAAQTGATGTDGLEGEPRSAATTATTTAENASKAAAAAAHGAAATGVAAPSGDTGAAAKELHPGPSHYTKSDPAGALLRHAKTALVPLSGAAANEAPQTASQTLRGTPAALATALVTAAATAAPDSASASASASTFARSPPSATGASLSPLSIDTRRRSAAAVAAAAAAGHPGAHVGPRSAASLGATASPRSARDPHFKILKRTAASVAFFVVFPTRRRSVPDAHGGADGVTAAAPATSPLRSPTGLSAAFRRERRRSSLYGGGGGAAAHGTGSTGYAPGLPPRVRSAFRDGFATATSPTRLRVHISTRALTVSPYALSETLTPIGFERVKSPHHFYTTFSPTTDELRGEFPPLTGGPRSAGVDSSTGTGAESATAASASAASAAAASAAAAALDMSVLTPRSPTAPQDGLDVDHVPRSPVNVEAQALRFKTLEKQRLQRSLEQAAHRRSRHLEERRARLQRRGHFAQYRQLLFQQRQRLEALRQLAQAKYAMNTAAMKRQLLLRQRAQQQGARVEHAQTVAMTQKLKQLVAMRRDLETLSRTRMSRRSAAYSSQDAKRTTANTLDGVAAIGNPNAAAIPASASASQEHEHHGMSAAAIAASRALDDLLKRMGLTPEMLSTGEPTHADDDAAVMTAAMEAADDDDEYDSDAPVVSFPPTSSPTRLLDLNVAGQALAAESTSRSARRWSGGAALVSSHGHRSRSRGVGLPPPQPFYELSEREYLRYYGKLLPPITRFTLRELDLDEMVSNIQLRHDLVFDAHIQFKPNTDGARAAAKRARGDVFWGNLAAHVAADQWEAVAVVLYEMRAIMLELLPFTTKLKEELEARIDIPLVQQQLAHRIFDMPALVHYLTALLKQHCAPSRDAMLDAIAASVTPSATAAAPSDGVAMDQVMTDAATAGAATGAAAMSPASPAVVLRALFDVLEIMKLDSANHQLRTLRPHIVERAHEFEAAWFADQHAHGLLGTKRTRAWLRYFLVAQNVDPKDLLQEGFVQMVADGHGMPDPTGAASGGPLPRLAEAAAVGSAADAADLSEEDGEDDDGFVDETPDAMYPETCQMDVARLAGMHTDFRDMCTLAQTLLVFTQVAGPRPAAPTPHAVLSRAHSSRTSLAAMASTATSTGSLPAAADDAGEENGASADGPPPSPGITPPTTLLQIKHELWVLVNDTETSLSHLHAFVLSRGAAWRGRPFTPAEAGVVKALLEKNLSPGSVVGKIMVDRVRKHLLTFVKTGQWAPLGPHGLEPLAAELADLGTRLAHLIAYHRKVLADGFYAPLIQRMQAAEKRRREGAATLATAAPTSPKPAATSAASS